MMHNAQALQMMVTANRATSDTIGEILSDIQAQGVRATQIIDRHRTMLRSHQLDKKPIDLHAVINESLALVAHDMRARQIEATVNLSSNPCVINGDQVLLQQVLVNLVMNAMDAMAETPPARRRVTISSEVRAADVEVSVRDTGPGLPADIIGTLFTPFVTTKSHGLGIGLTIARTIVDAHGGTIDARNNPEGGATFTVTLRRSEQRRPLQTRYTRRAMGSVEAARWSLPSSRMMRRRAQRWAVCSGRRDSSRPSSSRRKPTSTPRRRPRASSSTCSSPACRASSCSSGCAPPAPAPPIIVTTSRHEEVIRERAQQNGCAAFFWKPVDGNTLTATIASLANR